MTQIPLYPPHVRHSETSKDAADQIEASAATLRARVYVWLKQHGPATDEQMQERIPMPANTQRPRRVELVTRKFVASSGKKARTRSGREAELWKVIK